MAKAKTVPMPKQKVTPLPDMGSVPKNTWSGGIKPPLPREVRPPQKAPPPTVKTVPLPKEPKITPLPDMGTGKKVTPDPVPPPTIPRPPVVGKPKPAPKVALPKPITWRDRPTLPKRAPKPKKP